MMERPSQPRSHPFPLTFNHKWILFSLATVTSLDLLISLLATGEKTPEKTFLSNPLSRSVFLPM